MQKLLFVAAWAVAISASAQTANIYWDFNNATTAAAPSSGVFTGLTTPILGQGNNHGTTALLTATSASTTYTTAAGFANSGTTNAGAAAFTGVLNTATSTYFNTSLTLSPAAGASYTLTDVSLGSRSTSTGPVTLSLYDSTDSFATVFNLLGTVTVSANSVWAASDFSGLSVSIPADSSTLSFRIYGSGGTGSAASGTANWRIDDLTFSVSEVPEPSTLAFLGLGSLLAGVLVIRRHRI